MPRGPSHLDSNAVPFPMSSLGTYPSHACHQSPGLVISAPGRAATDHRWEKRLAQKKWSFSVFFFCCSREAHIREKSPLQPRRHSTRLPGEFPCCSVAPDCDPSCHHSSCTESMGISQHQADTYAWWPGQADTVESTTAQGKDRSTITACQ